MARADSFTFIFRFNLDADVGRHCPNKVDDVELVRYGYFCLKNNTRNPSNLTPRISSALQAMKIQGPFGPDLQEVIDAHEETRGGTIDGKVSISKAHLTTKERYDGVHRWIIDVLCNNMIDRNPNQYPRIDLDSVLGPEIKKRVRQIFALD